MVSPNRYTLYTKSRCSNISTQVELATSELITANTNKFHNVPTRFLLISPNIFSAFFSFCLDLITIF